MRRAWDSLAFHTSKATKHALKSSPALSAVQPEPLTSLPACFMHFLVPLLLLSSDSLSALPTIAVWWVVSLALCKAALPSHLGSSCPPVARPLQSSPSSWNPSLGFEGAEFTLEFCPQRTQGTLDKSVPLPGPAGGQLPQSSVLKIKQGTRCKGPTQSGM